MSLKPPDDFSGHLLDFYINQFVSQSGLSSRFQSTRFESDFIEVTNSDIIKGAELLKEAGLNPEKKPVIIHPGSGAINKSWHFENFLAVAKELISESYEVLFLLGPAELEKFSVNNINKITNLAKCLKELSFTDVLRLLSRAEVFIGNDSGITHLAAMLGVRTIAVFGPTNPDVYKPIGSNVQVLVNNTEAFATEPSPGSQQELLAAIQT
jgi:ADP-heptose:LPS heptosyltransferase